MEPVAVAVQPPAHPQLYSVDWAVARGKSLDIWNESFKANFPQFVQELATAIFARVMQKLTQRAQDPYLPSLSEKKFTFYASLDFSRPQLLEETMALHHITPSGENKLPEPFKTWINHLVEKKIDTKTELGYRYYQTKEYNPYYFDIKMKEVAHVVSNQLQKMFQSAHETDPKLADLHFEVKATEGTNGDSMLSKHHYSDIGVAVNVSKGLLKDWRHLPAADQLQNSGSLFWRVAAAVSVLSVVVTFWAGFSPSQLWASLRNAVRL